MRKAGLNILMSLKGDRKPVAFIEDCAVSLEHLADYTTRLNEVFKKYNTSGMFYAHASVGTLHVRPIINMKSDKDIAKSLNFLMEDVEGKKEQNVLTQLAIRSMAKAVYTTKKTSHYGLAFDHYTHFTSPIRRYPDVMVHRLLAAYLNGERSANEEEYETAASHSSAMEKRAADAERAGCGDRASPCGHRTRHGGRGAARQQRGHRRAPGA